MSGFIKDIILFIYNFIFIQYYPKSTLKIHKKISKDPIILINGLYNLQISQECMLMNMDIYNQSFLFNLLPLMNSKMNAEFCYKKIYGGLIDIGKYSEYSEGIYPIWSEDNPISFVAHSYGCNVLYELCKLLENEGKDPTKMIAKVVFINPLFLANKSNYVLYKNDISKYYFSWTQMTREFSILKWFYSPKNFILKKNKIPLNEQYNNIYQKISINNKNVFEFSDLDYNLEIINYLNRLKLTYKIYIGVVIFDFEYILNNIIQSIIYLFSSIRLNAPKHIIFDGMSYYEHAVISKIPCVENYYSLGHFDLFFDINPLTFARNKMFYFDILKYLRNKK